MLRPIYSKTIEKQCSFLALYFVLPRGETRCRTCGFCCDLKRVERGKKKKNPSLKFVRRRLFLVVTDCAKRLSFRSPRLVRRLSSCLCHAMSYYDVQTTRIFIWKKNAIFFSITSIIKYSLQICCNRILYNNTYNRIAVNC